jgi:hypothetical protein
LPIIGFSLGSLLGNLVLMMFLNPRMILDLFQGVALVRIEGKNVLNEMAHLRGQMIREFQIDILNTLVSFIIVVGFERWKTATKLETKDAQAPYIHSAVMWFLYHHFRR